MRAILTYHSIDDSGSTVSVSPEAFRRHVAWLASAPVETVSLDEVCDRGRESDAVSVTFDDAFVNFGEHAWPLLRDHGIPVTLFVATGRAGQDNAWGGVEDPRVPTLPVLDWDALAGLAEAGVTLGSHSVSHPDLTLLDDGALAGELERSAEEIHRRTGQRPSSFAYPFGRYDVRVARAAERTYRTACTTDMRVLRRFEHRLRLPRLDAYYFRREGWLEAWGRWVFRAHVGLRATARRARQVLGGR